MVDHKHYTYRVTWSEEDGEYVALCAEFPSLSYLDAKQSAALKGLTELVGEVIEDMLESGEEIPKPFSDKEYSGRFNLRMTPFIHRNLAIEAAELGVSLNRHINSKLA